MCEITLLSMSFTLQKQLYKKTTGKDLGDGWQTDGKQTLSVSGAAAHAKEAAISVFSWVEIQWLKATAYDTHHFLIFIKNEININV